jgi:acyl dehydratase
MATVEELKAYIGKKGVPTVYEIDRTMIRRFCEAIGDNSPRWRDVAPPGLLTAAMLMGQGVMTPPWPYPGIVDAGLELEYFKPIKAGDTITVVNGWLNIEDKSNEKRKMILFSMKSTFTNQRGEVVATAIGRVMNLG